MCDSDDAFPWPYPQQFLNHEQATWEEEGCLSSKRLCRCPQNMATEMDECRDSAKAQILTRYLGVSNIC